MTKNIGVCGLDCGVCETYLATIKNDDGEREKIAKEWGEKYQFNFFNYYRARIAQSIAQRPIFRLQVELCSF